MAPSDWKLVYKSLDLTRDLEYLDPLTIVLYFR